MQTRKIYKTYKTFIWKDNEEVFVKNILDR